MNEEWEPGWIVTQFNGRKQVFRVKHKYNINGHTIRVPYLVEPQIWRGIVYMSAKDALKVLLQEIEHHAEYVRTLLEGCDNKDGD
jgi:hypothetical protein